MKKNIYMKNRIIYLALLFLALSMYYGCGKDAAPVLYDEFKDKGTPDPVVTSVSPANFAFAGLDTLTITGSNFSDSAHTQVYFDNVQAAPISVTPTQIKVKAPNLPKDGVLIRVVVTTSSNYAPALNYTLKEIQKVYSGVLTYNDAATSLTFDKAGNLYIAMITKGTYMGVMKIDASKAMTEYSPKVVGKSEKSWTGLRVIYGPYGAGGQLFGARNNLGIWKINQGETASSLPWVSTDKKVNDFDADPDANIWTAGEGGILYKIKPDMSITKYTVGTTSKINAVRIFKDQGTLYVYLGGTKNGKEGVWRYKIANQEVDPATEELYLDYSSVYAGKLVLSLNLSVDGTLFIGTDAEPAIVVVDAAKAVKPFLPGVIIPKFLAFTYDSYDKVNGMNLVYSRASVTGETDKSYSPKLLSVNTFKPGAPYYGLEL